MRAMPANTLTPEELDAPPPPPAWRPQNFSIASQLVPLLESILEAEGITGSQYWRMLFIADLKRRGLLPAATVSVES